MEIRPELWQALESALQFPETADLRSLLLSLDAELAEQPPDKQLAIAGQVLADLSDVYCDRSNLMIEKWEQRHNPAEPIINLDDDAEFFVQSSSVALDDFFETPGHDYPAERQPASEPDPDASVVGEIDRVNLLSVVEAMQPLSEAEMATQVRSLAHGENIEAWTVAIVAFLDGWFAAGHPSIALVDLAQQMAMPFMEVWLGLLLGSHAYQLSATGDFYDPAGIDVQYRNENQVA